MKKRSFLPHSVFSVLPWLRWPVEIRTNGRLGVAGSPQPLQCAAVARIFNAESWLDRFFPAFSIYA
jgi:hypothetical protein